MEVYHKNARTRAATWVPRRVYYVLRHLQRTLTAGKAQARSNKQIQLAVKFGSEGEVSQIMRWLAGETPTMGRWAAGYLQANAQTHRFITRERMPSGAYRITLLAAPERIDAPRVALPQIVQLSFFGETNDPPMIPHAAQQDAAQGGSFFHDPFDRADLRQPKAARQRSVGDQHEENLKTQIQEEESAHTPLLARLLAQPGMDRPLAQRIAESPVGTLAEFEADLKLATTFAKSPFFFTVAKWRDSERVHAPEEHRREQSARSHSRSRRTAQAHPPSRSPADQDTDYAALLAEIAACNPGMQV